MIRTRYIAILSFLFTALFFIEYTPLSGRVHIPFDLEGYHYPLADYAFRAIRAGRFHALGFDDVLRDELRRKSAGRALLPANVADVRG